MNCATHPETAAAAFCRECGRPLCDTCRQTVAGSVYCADHAPAVVSAPMPPPPPAFPESPYASPYTAPRAVPYAPQVADPSVKPALAFLLGLIPGVGAIYNGQYAKGLIHAVVFGIAVSIEDSGRAGGSMEALVGIFLAAWVFYMAFEAYHTARKRRYGLAVEEFSSLVDVRPQQGRFPAGALVLIVVGCFLLLDTTDIIHMDQVARYWPAGLIALGIYMLYNRLGTAPRSDREGNR